MVYADDDSQQNLDSPFANNTKLHSSAKEILSRFNISLNSYSSIVNFDISRYDTSSSFPSLYRLLSVLKYVNCNPVVVGEYEPCHSTINDFTGSLIDKNRQLGKIVTNLIIAVLSNQPGKLDFRVTCKIGNTVFTPSKNVFMFESKLFALTLDILKFRESFLYEPNLVSCDMSSAAQQGCDFKCGIVTRIYGAFVTSVMNEALVTERKFIFEIFLKNCCRLEAILLIVVDDKIRNGRIKHQNRANLKLFKLCYKRIAKHGNYHQFFTKILNKMSFSKASNSLLSISIQSSLVIVMMLMRFIKILVFEMAVIVSGSTKVFATKIKHFQKRLALYLSILGNRYLKKFLKTIDWGKLV